MGVISDTHGALPDTVMVAFEGVEAIVHAGDIEDPLTLGLLRTVAPVTAARGNCDDHGETSLLPPVASVKIGGVRFLVAHKKRVLLARFDPAQAGARVVVTGHTHKAANEERDGVLYLNPGSASDPRDGNAATVAIVEIDGARVTAEIVELRDR